MVASRVNRFSHSIAFVPGADEPDAICSQVASILREERIKRELSLNVVAKRAGLSRQMVSYVEQEKRQPTLNTLLRITGVLDLDLDAVIRRAREAARRPARPD